jgi:FtsK/SpoIIIE family
MREGAKGPTRSPRIKRPEARRLRPLLNSGKTVALRSLLHRLAVQNPPARLGFVMVDKKGHDLTPFFSKSAHLRHPIVSNPLVGVRLLAWATTEMDRRLVANLREPVTGRRCWAVERTAVARSLAATVPATPTGFWDRQPKRTPRRFRLVLCRLHSGGVSPTAAEFVAWGNRIADR